MQDAAPRDGHSVGGAPEHASPGVQRGKRGRLARETELAAGERHRVLHETGGVVRIGWAGGGAPVGWGRASDPHEAEAERLLGEAFPPRQEDAAELEETDVQRSATGVLVGGAEKAGEDRAAQERER